jgi:hypothetical protein
MADGVKKQGNSLETQTRQLNNLTEAFTRLSNKIDNSNEQLNKFDEQMHKFRDYRIMVDEFNRSINNIRDTQVNIRLNGNSGNNSSGLNSRTIANTQRDSRVIEGTFRDLTRNVIRETDRLNREASSKWANLSNIILAPLTRNSELMRVGSSVVNNARTSFGNYRDFQRYRELASASSGAASAGAASGAGVAGAAGGASVASGALAFVAAGAAVAGVLYGLGKAAQYANERTVKIAQSLTAMGKSLDTASQAALNTRNNQIALSNTFENTLSNITSILEPALNNLMEFAVGIASAMGASTEEDLDKQLSTRADISTQAQLSGFNVGSANKLASDTYELANKFNEKFGVGVSELSKSLSDAWLNGSNAAAKYGVIVDDLTLKGYMASKGIDIANVEITDAMKQYYRYQLMEEELSAGSREAMSQNIKGWKEYGMVIDKTKQKLFSFDEVIQLSAFNPTIPELADNSLLDQIDDLKNKLNDNKEHAGLPLMLAEAANNLANAAAEHAKAAKSALEASNKNIDASNDFKDSSNKNIDASDKSNEAANKIVEASNDNVTASENNTNAANNNVSASNTNNKASQNSQNAATNNLIASRNAMNAANKFAISLNNAKVNLAKTFTDTNISQNINNAINEAKANSNTNSNTGFFGMSLMDIPLEAADYIHSLKDPETGKYDVSFNNMANKLGDFIVSSFVSPYSAAMAGFNEGNSKFGPLAGVLYGIGNLKAYASAEEAGDVLNAGAILGDLVKWETFGHYSSLSDNFNVSSDVFDEQVLNKITSSGFMSIDPTKLFDKEFYTSGQWNNITPLPDFLGIPGLSMNLGKAISDKIVPHFATGGIGTKESLITAFEGDKAEAVIPLESQAGIDYLANAMREAGGMSGAGNNIEVNLNVGMMVADNEEQIDRLTRMISDKLGQLLDDRGSLDYGGF